MITRRTVLLSASAAPLVITDRSRAETDPSDQIKYHAKELRRLLDMTKPDGTAPVQFALFDDRYGGFLVTAGSANRGVFEFSSDQPDWKSMVDQDGPGQAREP
jgi:hypothetical protein